MDQSGLILFAVVIVGVGVLSLLAGVFEWSWWMNTIGFFARKQYGDQIARWHFIIVGLVAIGMGAYFAGSVSEEPEVIVEVTRQIAEIDVPQGLEPTVSFDMKIPFTGERMMAWVVYLDEATESLLVLGTFGGPMAAQGQEEQVWQQIEQALQEEGIKHEANVRDWKRYEKEITVRGEPVTFYFATGKDEDSGAQRIEVTGTFPGDENPVLFSFSGDAEKYDEQAIVDAIESIR